MAAKKPKWTGATMLEELVKAEKWTPIMVARGAEIGIPPAFTAAFEAKVDIVRDLYTKIDNKIATGLEKIQYHDRHAEMVTLMQTTRSHYIEPADESNDNWAAWGLAPRSLHNIPAAQIFTALTVAHKYIAGTVGLVIFTFTPVGSKGWGKEPYCDSFEMFFKAYTPGDPIPTTTAEIEALPGRLTFTEGRPTVDMRQYRGQNLMIFVRMVNHYPVPGPFNSPPDFVQITKL